jgi:arsenite methyltransferase
MGGLKATRELIESCHIGQGQYILDVGCGTGVTPCYLVKRYGCRVVGIDISDKMIVWANETASSERVESRVEFRVADAQELPFDNAIFDVVICESVNVFVPDKPKAVDEYARVIKPGGYVGLSLQSFTGRAGKSVRYF